MQVAVKINENNIIVGYLYLASEDYTNLLNNNSHYNLVNVNNLSEIIEYKTKYQNGELVQLDDYDQAYYDKQNAEEQRQTLQEQLRELNGWFDKYDMQIKQYERDVRLGVSSTYHIDNETYTIAQLDSLAIEKARSISSIREQISNLQV